MVQFVFEVTLNDALVSAVAAFQSSCTLAGDTLNTGSPAA